jgi:type IV secretory pathway TrbD component
MDANAAYRRACPRTLDRPILIFGLEPEDLVIVGLLGGGLLFVTDPLLAVGAGFSLWIALLKLKAGKPPGYLFTLAYKHGLVSVLPRSCSPPQLLPPPREGRPVRLSAFGGDDDDPR